MFHYDERSNTNFFTASERKATLIDRPILAKLSLGSRTSSHRQIFSNHASISAFISGRYSWPVLL